MNLFGRGEGAGEPSRKLRGRIESRAQRELPRIEGEERVEGANRLRIEGEARTEGKARENYTGRDPGRGLVSSSQEKF